MVKRQGETALNHSFPPADVVMKYLIVNGEGMFRFTTLEQAAKAFDVINADYERHCRAARMLAETQFDARRVMAKVLSFALNGEAPGRDSVEPLFPAS